MNPRDFINTASHLKDQEGEHFIRTSISRSYYAVHLYIRQFISSTFLGDKKFKNDPHRNVIHCLQKCEAKEIKSIGVILLDLLQARTDADYQMAKEITPKRCQDIFDEASELLLEFDNKVAIPINIQKFAKSSQQQARNEGILPR